MTLNLPHPTIPFMIFELDNKEISFKYSLQDTDLEISERGIVGQERALKALRTGYETSNANAMLNGELLDDFIQSFYK